jgi:hypothetical protein
MPHRQHSLILLLAGGLIVVTSLPAASQQLPSMVGTWKGTGTGVQIGPTPYRPAEGTGVKFPDNEIEFTYDIKEQHGNRFTGQLSGGTHKETIIGAVQLNNRGGVMLDDDGKYLFTLIDPNTMDLCYDHHYSASKFVGCFRVKRSP